MCACVREVNNFIEGLVILRYKNKIVQQIEKKKKLWYGLIVWVWSIKTLDAPFSNENK